jgi:hypothetical protein
MEGARVTSVISNRCIRTRLLVFKNLAIAVCVCDAEYYLQILCGCLSPGSAVGQGLRPFVVYPPSCRGGGFYTTEQFMGVFVSLVLCCHFWGPCFSTVSNILLLFDVCLSLIWLSATVSLYMW